MNAYTKSKQLVLTTLLSSVLVTSTAMAAPPNGEHGPFQNIQSDQGQRSPQRQDRQDSRQGREADQFQNIRSAPDQSYRGDTRYNRDYPPRGHQERNHHYHEGWGGVSREHARNFAYEEGIHGYKPLPPGIRRNLRYGHPLPPGIAMRPVPPQLLRRLPPQPGYEWHIVGSDLVLTAIGTAIVADILINVLQ